MRNLYSVLVLVVLASTLVFGCVGNTFTPQEGGKSVSVDPVLSGTLWDPCGGDHGNIINNRRIDILNMDNGDDEVAYSDSSGDWSASVDSGDRYWVVVALGGTGYQASPSYYQTSAITINTSLDRFCIYGNGDTYDVSGSIILGPGTKSGDEEDVNIKAHFYGDSIVTSPEGNLFTDANGDFSGPLYESKYDLTATKTGFTITKFGWSGYVHIDGADVSGADFYMTKP